MTQTVIEGGTPTVELIAAEGGQALFQGCDVSDGAQVDALVARAVAEFGALDVMVNNACIRIPGPCWNWTWRTGSGFWM